LGDVGPAGGIIFATPSSTGNFTGDYFEVAPSDALGPSNETTSVWCNTTSASTSYESRMGLGEAESGMIVAMCTSSAAARADSYSTTVDGVTFSDWYLPSRAEISSAWNYRSLLSGFSTGDYWTTTENSSAGGSESFVLNASTGAFSSLWQTSLARIRPVRQFR
jgi:hypothetical protein